MSDFIADMVRRKGSTAKIRQDPAGQSVEAGREPTENAAATLDPPVVPADDQRSEQMQIVEASGLFDTEYYLSSNPDVEEAGVHPLEHFFDAGYLEGRRPNFYFDPSWYLDRYSDIRAAGMH